MSALPATEAPVLAASLYAGRRSTVLWCLGLLAVVGVYLPVFPSYAGTDTLDEQVAALPDGVSTALGIQGLGSAAGYVQSTVFGLLGMLLLLVLALSAGARLLAGDEEAGHLDLLLAAPLSRRRLVLKRALALAGLVALPGAVLTAGVLVVSALVGIDLPVGGVLRAGLALTLLAIAAGCLALLAGAWRGRRAVALGVATALTVLLFLLNAVGPQVAALSFAAEWSPFAWYLQHNTVTAGPFVLHLLGLALLGPVLTGLAVLAVQRRDLTT